MKRAIIIRDRGQLTIPDTIRKIASWAQPSSAVSISVENPDEIKITPLVKEKKFDWDTIWDRIKKSRSIKGKDAGKLSTADFLEKDRRSH